MFRLVVGAGAVGLGAAAYIQGSQARDLSRALDVHEPLLAAFANDEWKRTTLSLPWSTPRTVGDSATHVFGDLTVDCYDNGIKHDLDKKSFTLFVAPPSFVSTRTMFLPMAPYVANHFGVTEIAGYGVNQAPLRSGQLTPEVFESGLEATLKALIKHSPEKEAPVVVAAGHAAVYALRLAQRQPELFKSLIMLNPTYRGPLATAEYNIREEHGSFAAATMAVGRRLLWQLLRVPYVGEALSLKFASEESITQQLRSHVYADEATITPEMVAHHQGLAQAGAFAPKAAFLTGQTDPLDSREAMDEVIAGGFKVPTMVLMGVSAPETNKADLTNLESKTEERALTGEGERCIAAHTPGALRSFEEYPMLVGNLVRSHAQLYC
eukprot:m.50497 g.50497  ORF g.50497 m.50497 type:complete len:380 (-) comp13427_c0_seq1:34-1173(-)